MATERKGGDEKPFAPTADEAVEMLKNGSHPRLILDAMRRDRIFPREGDRA